VQTKKHIESLQESADSARLNVNSVNDALLLILKEGPFKINLDERAEILDRVLAAIDSLLEIRKEMEGW